MRRLRWLSILALAAWIGLPQLTLADKSATPVSYVCDYADGLDIDGSVGGTGIQLDELRLEPDGPAITFLLPATEPRSFTGAGIIWQSPDCPGFPYVQDAIKFINRRFDNGATGILIDLLNSGADLDAQPALVLIVEGSSYTRPQAEALLEQFRQAGSLFQGITFSWEDGSNEAESTTPTTTPTEEATEVSTEVATEEPIEITEEPTDVPTDVATEEPLTEVPTEVPTEVVTQEPTAATCTPMTITADSSPFVINSEGPAVVDLTTRTGQQYKVWLSSGNTLPGTGTAQVYPSQACKDAAWQAYLADPLPLRSFDEIWNDNNTGADCTPTTVTFSDSVGDFAINNSGPSVVDLTTRKGKQVKVMVQGNVTLPGTGTAKQYFPGCGDVAGQEFDNDPLPASTFDEVWADQNATPTPTATAEPTETSIPTDVPTEEATEEPTEVPTEVVTEEPTQDAAIVEVTDVPTEAATGESAQVDQTDSQPTEEATEVPTDVPTEVVTEEPTDEPVQEASEPTEEVTQEATEVPTQDATQPPVDLTEASTEESAPAEVTTEDVETPEPVATDQPADASISSVEEIPTEEATEAPTETPTAEAVQLRFWWMVVLNGLPH